MQSAREWFRQRGRGRLLAYPQALPEEYSVSRKMLEREREKLTIGQLRTELLAQYSLEKGEDRLSLSLSPSHQTAPILRLTRGVETSSGAASPRIRTGEPMTRALV